MGCQRSTVALAKAGAAAVAANALASDCAPLFQYYHSGHLVWKRCDGPMNDKIGNAVVEAYYRDSGEIDLNYAHVPSSFVVRSNEETMISDHFGGSYIEWMQYALQTGRNWTSVFEPVINGTSTDQNLLGTRN